MTFYDSSLFQRTEQRWCGSPDHCFLISAEDNFCSVWVGSAAEGGGKGLCLHLPNDLVITSFLAAISIAVELGRIWLCSGLVKTHRFGKEIPRAWLQCVEIGVGWVSSEIWRSVWSALNYLHSLTCWCCRMHLVSITLEGCSPGSAERRGFAALFGFGNSISPCAEPHPCYENEEFHSDVW